MFLLAFLDLTKKAEAENFKQNQRESENPRRKQKAKNENKNWKEKQNNTSWLFHTDTHHKILIAATPIRNLRKPSGVEINKTGFL